ncbi:MAG: hypothetical protein ABIR27_02090 [Dokdonella sp.]
MSKAIASPMKATGFVSLATGIWNPGLNNVREQVHRSLDQLRYPTERFKVGTIRENQTDAPNVFGTRNSALNGHDFAVAGETF